MKVRVLIATILTVASVCSCCSRPHGDPLGHAYHDLIEALGNQSLSVPQRHTARFMLVQAHSRDVLPLLISSLQDTRVHDPEASGPGEPADGSTHIVETVGKTCEAMLYEIVLRGEPRRAFRITDWNQWWEANRDKDMGSICDEAIRQNGPPSEEEKPRPIQWR